MTLRTITFDDSTHKLVPIIADESMLQKGEYYCESTLLVWRDMIAAAPEYQEPTESSSHFAYFKDDCGKWQLIQDTKKDE